MTPVVLIAGMLDDALLGEPIGEDGTLDAREGGRLDVMAVPQPGLDYGGRLELRLGLLVCLHLILLCRQQ